jgi:NADH-quinone oxidoreductase subunit C/D
MTGGGVFQDLQTEFGPDSGFVPQSVRDDIPTIWIPRERLTPVLQFLKNAAPQPYRMLYDLTAIDERRRTRREGQPESDFTLVYHLLSLERNADVRLKVALRGEYPAAASATNVFPSANWYEREVWDMFGIKFEGHPDLRRILMPPTWEGHPLRKEHPARATELGPFQLPSEKVDREQEALRFRPEEWGLASHGDDSEYLFLNLGPNHPGVHGVIRFLLRLDGEEILDVVPEIGFHHRGAEKMAERQTWHTFIPYTDRVDYLGGSMNNLAYLLAVEKLGGVDVPDRAKVIRIMLAEFFRLASHLVWYGTLAQDLGALSPVLFTFNDRERIFDIIMAITGGRMHPSWFRIGGVADDLPRGWERMVDDFLRYLPARLREYDGLILGNRIFQGRTKGIGAFTQEEAIEWGVTGPGLRSTGLGWDFRKQRPYGGYDQFEFEVPVGARGDCYDRATVRVEEMRQSLRIIAQCRKNMPAGPYKSSHPLAVPPDKERTLRDIETLIDHFLSVSWGPVLPAGEAFAGIEATKGNNGYYLISDGGIHAYRARIRAPSFPHIQMVPLIARGVMISDLIAILGSVDFVLADVDR